MNESQGTSQIIYEFSRTSAMEGLVGMGVDHIGTCCDSISVRAFLSQRRQRDARHPFGSS